MISEGNIAVADLVGHDIAGLRANVTEMRHRDSIPVEDQNIVTLKRAEWKRRGNGLTLYLYWDIPTASRRNTCGFSGWGRDVDFTPTITILPRATGSVKP